ncbi:Serine phosphatase RsbU [Peptoniphilus sp. ING2-D1G]|nr:Serine phosphatase RsbU [Peptoniphilus sp. ING2-D1G]
MVSVYKDMIFNESKLNYQILDAIADLVRVVDANNQVIFVNEAMSRQLGYDVKTLVCSISENEVPLNIAKRTIETGETIQREEIIKDFHYSVKCSPIKDSKGDVLGAVEVFRNTSIEHKLVTEIIDKNKKLTIEMAKAKKIQTSLLPKQGFMENIKINYIYEPYSILSGDIFDIFKIDKDNFAIYISDTVGHGFASSMVTMFVRFIMRNLSPETLKVPSQTLGELQEKFSELDLDLETYFTCFYGIYNRKKAKLIYSNAGHYPAPILLSGEKINILETPGYPITKFLNKFKYEDKTVDFNISDKLLLMTDGVVDAKNYHKDNYGMSRVLDILKGNENGELSVLRKSLNGFIWGEQKDDITALLLKVW